MKIYFTVSLSQLDDSIRDHCIKIVDYLRAQGHQVFPSNSFQAIPNYSEQSEEEALQAQKQLTKMKKTADLVIAEITKQSLGIGQEIALALSMNKPVIGLYEKGHRPHVLRDEGGDLLLLSEYTDKNLVDVLEDSLEYASSHQDVRFNFFISPAIGNYLDWIAKDKKIPRSVYLRNLIEKDMEDNEEYH